uniref:Uncharacterized protein n=1 Tax=Moniliophthora roreri TaxID=221103 RepID=A0A0W0FJC2_MONRR
MSERKIDAHLEDTVKKQYNKLCADMAKLVGTKAASLSIDTKSLFNLDINDAIWHNVGLFEEDSHPPAWLADDNV